MRASIRVLCYLCPMLRVAAISFALVGLSAAAGVALSVAHDEAMRAQMMPPLSEPVLVTQAQTVVSDNAPAMILPAARDAVSSVVADPLPRVASLSLEALPDTEADASALDLGALASVRPQGRHDRVVLAQGPSAVAPQSGPRRDFISIPRDLFSSGRGADTTRVRPVPTYRAPQAHRPVAEGNAVPRYMIGVFR